eukprot:CAMPEP_0197456072 /NCGR_PEP_ID=MMETSP1175-20131217/42430_1 /TAXON_ID=1003142 /ORGANISM="Triceratium dubium, Strain CCMP147" /LENGTH=419 /DNA_ID=CAMNT_0042990089 /DNA_START=24 /DNA_END=1283 /DNA_ORIENTATION=+
MMVTTPVLLAAIAIAGPASGFVPTLSKYVHGTPTALCVASVETTEENSAIDARRRRQKEALLGLIGSSPTAAETGDGASSARTGYDPVLACPETKEAIRVTRDGPILAGNAGPAGTKVSMRTSPSSELVYSGRTDTYLNLLEAQETTSNSEEGGEATVWAGVSNAANSLRVFIPPPIRSAMATAGLMVSEDYVPMRDLFTSPSVSFAYERGWRQGFAAAGFPGPDKEAELVREFFEPVTIGAGPSTVVDMSCATGLFTRRLAKSCEYDRVIGCDFSESMLLEARRRIRADPELRNQGLSSSRLDLVRCDVGRIPMQTESVDALHAGAAMHCWPDLDAALSEIHRVLKPGGRYFATTFLSDYFRTLQQSEGGQTGPSMQAFQYFESVDMLRKLVVKAGFAPEKVEIEVLGAACVVIRCEK